MQLLAHLSEIDDVRQRLAAKNKEYADAMKAGKEFSFVKKIFLEIKSLRARLQYLVKN